MAFKGSTRIPIVQVSLPTTVKDSVQLGISLSALRVKGYDIVATGQVVHNLRDVCEFVVNVGQCASAGLNTISLWKAYTVRRTLSSCCDQGCRGRTLGRGGIVLASAVQASPPYARALDAIGCSSSRSWRGSVRNVVSRSGSRVGLGYVGLGRYINHIHSISLLSFFLFISPLSLLSSMQIIARITLQLILLSTLALLDICILLYPSCTNASKMSSILNAILRSVSGVKVPETPDTPETPEKEGEEGEWDPSTVGSRRSVFQLADRNHHSPRRALRLPPQGQVSPARRMAQGTDRARQSRSHH